MALRISRRQRVRKSVLLGFFLIFPIIMNYFSPYLIIDGASRGIVNGSFIVFGSLFLSSLFFGRARCGWVCAAGGLQEATSTANPGPFKTGRRDWIKWFIWVPWVGAIAAAAISAGGFHQVNFFHMTETGVSVTEPRQYVTYLVVVGLFFGLAVFAGRRAACHTICWMAPFMIAGRWLRNRFAWPALRLVASPASCIECLKCTTGCPMSLDVHAMVQVEHMEHPECILCGTCVDNCAHKAIKYSFSAGK